ncbi:hypothetical protein PybrP1_007488 [[Pythium] brassicae (nom. inval.)]|nr:hypothetical protein PybrP1_007488 [[Pythium] brassicae (nom. inval.)]
MAKRSAHHHQRRGSQAFRSRELLASLTLSAEAITIGDHQLLPQQEPALEDGPSLTAPAPRLGLARVSQMKVAALQMRQRARKERRTRRRATLSVTHESEGVEEAAAQNTTTASDCAKAVTRQPIGLFETADVKWSAAVEGEIEKFMYPSLRLEALYDTGSSSNDRSAATAEARASHRESSSGSGSNSNSAKQTRLASQQPLGNEAPAFAAKPSAEAVDAAMTPSATVDWTLEKRYQNSSQSAPPNGHTRADEQELKRLQFDQQLEMAECMLRKKELLDVERRRDLRAAERGTERPIGDEQAPGEAALEAERIRSASLYHPSLALEQMLIPRLPQTRKIVKQIQRHTTSEGQIKYYADKQNLFTKWKKLQTAQQHQPAPERHAHTADQEEDGAEEADDDTLQPFGALSPRSLFYHECVKRQVLPEPVFSRIHDVMETTTAHAAASGHPMSFTIVAATLIRAVRDKYAGDPDGPAAAANGQQVVRKKHHLALHLQHFGLGDAKTNALSAALQRFPSIQVLDLSDNRLTDAAILPLLQSLEAACSRPRSSSSSSSGGAGAHSPTSRRAIIRLSQVAARVGSAVSSMARKGSDLRRLNLSHNAIGARGCAQLARFLGVCSLLTHLDLSHTSLRGDEALAPLTTAIECHPSLQVVNLSYNNIEEKGGALLGDMITQPSCGVAELDVSWNQICRHGAVAIGEALRTNTALRSLNLAMNRCGDDGGEQLAAAMATNASLRALDLSRNAFGGRTAVAFAFFLRQNASLETLCLQDNSLGAVGTRALLQAVACGSRCEFRLSVHDVEASTTASATPAAYDFALPALASPFELKLGASPYEFAVANLLVEAALVHRRCALSELVFTEESPAAAARLKRVALAVDIDAGAVVELPTRRAWRVPANGVLCASARFVPPPMPMPTVIRSGSGSVATPPQLELAACLALVRVIKRGFSTREMLILLDLVFSDLYLTIEQATLFVEQLRGTLSAVDVVGRLWPCLVEGDRVFAFMQTHLTPAEQRRLVDAFGASVIQFTTANPTGRWTLDLSDTRQRKVALWFAMINASEAAYSAQFHAKRTDNSQYGKGNNWRNVSFNRKAIRLTNEFFQQLPQSGILEFDYVSTVRHEDVLGAGPTELTDESLSQLMKQVGAEVCAIYIPLHKRKDLKYQLLFFHLAIADKFLTCEQAHYVLQHFPKNYETCRFRILISVHRTLIDLEGMGELLDRLTAVDRRRVYQALGYLNVVSPLAVDLDYELDFEREDEKTLLRALVDLSMASPMDLIRIESERSDVLVIYSMYQTNSVPSSGKIFFRYVSHANGNRGEWLRGRQSLFRHFLCGARLRSLPDSVLVSTMGIGAAGTSASRSASVVALPPARPKSATNE